MSLFSLRWSCKLYLTDASKYSISNDGKAPRVSAAYQTQRFLSFSAHWFKVMFFQLGIFKRCGVQVPEFSSHQIKVTKLERHSFKGLVSPPRFPFPLLISRWNVNNYPFQWDSSFQGRTKLWKFSPHLPKIISNPTFNVWKIVNDDVDPCPSTEILHSIMLMRPQESSHNCANYGGFEIKCNWFLTAMIHCLQRLTVKDIIILLQTDYSRKRQHCSEVLAIFLFIWSAYLECLCQKPLGFFFYLSKSYVFIPDLFFYFYFLFLLLICLIFILKAFGRIKSF